MTYRFEATMDVSLNILKDWAFRLRSLESETRVAMRAFQALPCQCIRNLVMELSFHKPRILVVLRPE